MYLDLNKFLQAAQATGALAWGQKTLSDLATMYGCCALFQPSGDNDLLSTAIPDETFLEWLGWKPNNECRQFVKLLTYTGPAGTAAGSPESAVKAACEDGASVEFGVCEVLLPDKGRIKVTGPVRDLTENNRKPWEEYPVFTKDGQQITDELYWSITLAGLVVKQELMRLIVEGNPANANEFAGLEYLVNTGYVNAVDGRACPEMDSIVIDWNDQDMSTGPDGVHSFVDYLVDVIRRIRTRVRMAKLGNVAESDMVIVLPSYHRDELLDQFTCWSVCSGEITRLMSYEARQYRDKLNGGAFGMGQIIVDGTIVPIITFDYLPLTSTGAGYTSDVYVLTRRIGNLPVLFGQYIDMRDPAQAFANQAGTGTYKATDNGRFLVYWKTDNECVAPTVVFRPNIYLSAPWACARFQDVLATRPLAPVSSRPSSPYYPGAGSLSPASCPEDYLVGPRST